MYNKVKRFGGMEMNLLYYSGNNRVNNERSINAINLDLVKIIECRKIEYETEITNFDVEAFGLYLDDILVHYFYIKDAYEIYDKFLSDENEIKKAYEIYCKEFVKDEEENQLLNKAGFEGFNQYIKKSKLTSYEIYRDYQFAGVVNYTRILEKDKWFPNSKEITYKLFILDIFDYYVTKLKYMD